MAWGSGTWGKATTPAVQGPNLAGAKLLPGMQVPTARSGAGHFGATVPTAAPPPGSPPGTTAALASQPGAATALNMFSPPQPQPARSPLVDTSQSGFMNQPGTGEQWFADHQKDVNRPLGMDSFLQASQGRVLGMNYAPDNASSAYGKMSSELGTAGKGVTNAWDVASQLRDKTAGEDMMGKAANMFAGPNMAHDYATQTAGEFRAPGASENYYSQVAPGLQQQGQGEQNAYNLLGQFKDPGAAENNLSVTDAALGKINYGDMGIGATKNLTGNAAGYFGQNLKDVNGTNIVGQESQNFLPGLREKSNSENLYDSGNTGLNTAYDREAQKRTRELQNRMAATGMFGSGTTARGMEEIQADIASSQARDMASLANQADQARLGRTGAALSFSDAAGKEGLNRLDVGLRGASAADASNLGNVNAMLGATGQASTEALGKVGARTTAADASERAQLDRLFKSGQTGLAADQQGLNRITEGGTLANNAQTGEINRLLGGSTVAAAGDHSLYEQASGLGTIGHNQATDEINRLGTSATAGTQADNARTQQLDALMKGATSLDDLRTKAAQIGINIEDLLGKETQSSDQLHINQTTANQTMANSVQDQFQNRYQTQADNLFRGATGQSGLVSSSTGAASDTDLSLGRDKINGLITSGKLTQQQGDQLQEQLLTGATTVAQIESMFAKK